jgi:hypothetical protein
VRFRAPLQSTQSTQSAPINNQREISKQHQSALINTNQRNQAVAQSAQSSAISTNRKRQSTQ